MRPLANNALDSQNRSSQTQRLMRPSANNALDYAQLTQYYKYNTLINPNYVTTLIRQLSAMRHATLERIHGLLTPSHDAKITNSSHHAVPSLQAPHHSKRLRSPAVHVSTQLNRFLRELLPRDSNLA